MRQTWRVWFWENGLSVSAITALGLWPLLVIPSLDPGPRVILPVMALWFLWFTAAGVIRINYPERSDLPEYQEWQALQRAGGGSTDGWLGGRQYRENGRVGSDPPRKRWITRRR